MNNPKECKELCNFNITNSQFDNLRWMITNNYRVYW